ncbi:MAG: hypothetical protein M1389_09220, partial [Chloroflexi bacterium]|nr:hypothetical protein [Chloroflexota bacterium]
GGYNSFREAAVHSNQSGMVLRASAHYDFNKVTSYLTSADWSQWSIRTCKDVLDTFNLLWDMAITTGYLKVLADHTADREVRTFLDTLTFITSEGIKDLNAFDSGHISTVFTENVARIVTRVILLC